MKTAPDALRAAKNLLSDESFWWRGPKSGPRSEHCHCLITAVLACGGSYVMKFLEAVIGWPLAIWNGLQSTTFADVHAVFDAAILLAEGL